MSLLSLFGIAKKKPAPLTPAQEHLQFIDNTCKFFDLPWDGRKRLSEASPVEIEDIKDIRQHSERAYQDNMKYMSGVPLPSCNLFWQHRIEHTALVMAKLGYREEDIAAHKKYIRAKHAGTHFPPPR